MGHLQRPGGRRLAWRSTGPTEAPALLWLHGSTGSARTAPVLAGVRVVSFDRPGYATSTAHSGRDLRSDAADVESLLDDLAIGEVWILAFSGGAATAYAAAARLPQRVRHLGIVSGATWPAAPAPPLDVLRAAAEALRADPAAAVDRLCQDAPARDRQVLADPGLRQELLDGARDAVAAGVDGWIREAQLLRSPWPLQPRDITVPVTLWHGEEDLAVPLSAAEATAAALPQGRLERLPEAGHLGWMTDRAGILTSVLAV